MEKVITADQVLDELARRYRDELRELQALGTEQAAKALGVSVATVKRWCDAGKLQCFKSVGGHRRVTAQSVADYLNANGLELHPDPNASVPYRLAVGVDLAAKDGDETVRTTMQRNPDGTTSLVSVERMSSVTGVVLSPDGKTSTIVGQVLPAAAVSEDDVVELNQ